MKFFFLDGSPNTTQYWSVVEMAYSMINFIQPPLSHQSLSWKTELYTVIFKLVDRLLFVFLNYFYIFLNTIKNTFFYQSQNKHEGGVQRLDRKESYKAQKKSYRQRNCVVVHLRNKETGFAGMEMI